MSKTAIFGLDDICKICVKSVAEKWKTIIFVKCVEISVKNHNTLIFNIYDKTLIFGGWHL